MTAAELQAWVRAHEDAVAAVRDAQAAIQTLATHTEGDADMKCCFAGTSLHGALALLREADVLHRQTALPLVEAPR